MIPDGSSILDFSLRNTPSNSLPSAGAQLSHICTQLKKFQTELITFLPKVLLSICFFFLAKSIFSCLLAPTRNLHVSLDNSYSPLPPI